jgi:hypothetical protein
MSVQQANCYAYQVKRISLMTQGPNQGAPQPGYTPGAYLGEEVFVFAASQAQAMVVLGQVYGSDLGPVTGGATLVPGAWTTMTGS